MLFIISGDIGAGKSTVCEKVVAMAAMRGMACGGVLTAKSPDGGLIVKNIWTGEAMPLASLNSTYPGPNVGKFCFNPDAVAFGNRAIRAAARSDVLVVDEIGPLELAGGGFAAVLELLHASVVNNCLLVIRSGLLSHFLPGLPAAPLVFQTTLDNRNRLPGDIVSALSRHVRPSDTKTGRPDPA